MIKLFSFSYPTDSWDNVINVKYRAIVTHFRRYRQNHVRWFFIWFSSFFFSGICRCETNTCAVFHTTQRACEEISVKCLSQEDNDIMPSTVIEPATLRSLARRSNQLSFAAAYARRSQLSRSSIYFLSRLGINKFI